MDTVAVSEAKPVLNLLPDRSQGSPTIATATGQAFLNNPLLHQEVFGPYSLIIRCKDMKEMLQVANQLEGQLTATLMATENDIRINDKLVEAVKNICGRFILNSVPTGVEVCLEYAAWRAISWLARIQDLVLSAQMASNDLQDLSLFRTGAMNCCRMN